MGQFLEDQGTLAEVVTKLLGGPYPLNFFTHMNEDVGFLYFSAPGVANIRTIGSLSLAVAETLGIDFRLDNMGQIYKRQARLLDSPETGGQGVFERMLQDPDVVRITFFRDPADRFAALYHNVFSINTLRAEPRMKLFDFLGMPIEENLSMLDLAELICEEEGLKALLPQLRSQRQMTAFDLVDYDFIGRHETWPVDFAKISLDIFGRETRQFDPVSAFNKDPEGTMFKRLIDADTKAALKLAYAEDYDMMAEISAIYPQGFLQES
ncbi:MAG: sulfotransferase family protein [Rhodobacteraceae bacterium]|nr:sulfotransferase family protein [Paracoccaceae bacterium]